MEVTKRGRNSDNKGKGRCYKRRFPDKRLAKKWRKIHNRHGGKEFVLTASYWCDDCTVWHNTKQHQINKVDRSGSD